MNEVNKRYSVTRQADIRTMHRGLSRTLQKGPVREINAPFDCHRFDGAAVIIHSCEIKQLIPRFKSVIVGARIYIDRERIVDGRAQAFDAFDKRVR